MDLDFLDPSWWWIYIFGIGLEEKSYDSIINMIYLHIWGQFVGILFLKHVKHC